MATNTPNYGLVKPAQTDFYDINVQNGNMDKIDGTLKQLDEKIDNVDLVEIGGLPRKNILDNPYFKINSRNITEITDVNVYTVDRYRINGDQYVTVIVTDNGLILSTSDSNTTYGYLTQGIPTDTMKYLLGKKITVSILTSTGLFSGSGVVPSEIPSINTRIATAVIDSNSQFEVFLRSDDRIAAQIRLTPGTTLNVIATKIEVGDSQTLAYQDVNGVWHLYDDYDITLDMLNCDVNHYLLEGVRTTNFAKATGLNQIDNATGKYTKLTENKTVSSTATANVTPIPTGGWIESGSGEYKSGGYRIFASSHSSLDVTKAFDQNSSTFWQSGSESNRFVGVELPSAIKVTKCKISYSSNNGTSSCKIQGSNNGTTWSDLYSEGAKTAAESNTLREVTLTNPGSYKFYRLVPVASSVVSISEFQLSSYEFTTYNVAYTAIDVPTTWEDGQILLVETPANDAVGVTTNSVNGISIDIILKPSTKYKLIYNSNKFYGKEVA